MTLCGNQTQQKPKRRICEFDPNISALRNKQPQARHSWYKIRTFRFVGRKPVSQSDVRVRNNGGPFPICLQWCYRAGSRHFEPMAQPGPEINRRTICSGRIKPTSKEARSGRLARLAMSVISHSERIFYSSRDPTPIISGEIIANWITRLHFAVDRSYIFL